MAYLKNQLTGLPNAPTLALSQPPGYLLPGVLSIYGNEHCRCPSPLPSTQTECLYSGFTLTLCTASEEGRTLALLGYKEVGSLYNFLVLFQSSHILQRTRFTLRKLKTL